MKISKLASVVFAVVGTVLLVGSIAVSFVALNSQTKAIEPTEEAKARAREVLYALEYDFEALEGFLYGKPSLGLDRQPATAEGRKLWDAYIGSIAVTADEGCFGRGANIYQSAQVTHMDIAQTLSGLDKRAGELLKKKLDAQEDHFALLGEDGQIPQTLKDELRTQAFREALEEQKTVTTQITFQLIEKDGQWWILPDQAMLDILSGGLN